MLVAIIKMVSIAKATIAIAIAIWSVAIRKESIAIIQNFVGFPLLPGEA